nr:reverse transcriptase domain-containing protein [Tanacetum cinerariifolium]
MADQRTMAKLLRAPTEGYAEAIVVPLILAKQFELKHSLINMMTMDQFFELEKDNPYDHIRWFNKITSTIKYKDVPSSAIKLMLFPFSLDRYKDLLRACPHHGFTELHQLDTFYNALNPADQDSLNAATGGNFLERSTQDVLKIIENKSKVRNSRSKPVVSQVKACDVNSNSSSEIAKLTHAVNQQTSAVTTAMTTMLKQFQATPPPAPVKAVEEICVTCGGAHSYYQCLAASGNTFLKPRDHIQGYVSAAAVNYNQGNPGYRPPGSGSLPSNIVANPKGELKAITTCSGLVIDGPTIPTPPQSINLEVDERIEETFTDPDLAGYTIKVPPPPIQKYKPPSQREYIIHQRDPLHPNIPYPSRMLNQKQQEKDEVQIQKNWQMFKQLHINITIADALILIPKYQKMLKALLSNKEKLQELANTPFNVNCSAVILKKLPKKLEDPGKFLISCGFSELKCKALADLGASINLMPLFVWKKLGLPELIPTHITLELANRAICTPVGIARDVFVPIARALIDVHGEEMILRDVDERLTLNMRHDTSSYSNQPQKESINLINVFNNSSEDFLEAPFPNQPSGNPTFLSHPELTLPKVNNDIFDSEGCNVLSEKLLDLDSTKDLHPPLHDNPLSGSTTYFSNPLLEEFADELPLKYDDNLQFDIESDLKEIEFMLYQDKILMFTDEHALDYSSPLIFDEYDDDFLEVESDAGNFYNDTFDSKGEKIK